MKTRITRLAPHQNGIVVGVLMGVASLVFVVPAYLFMQAAPLIDPAFAGYAIPSYWLLAGPIVYALVGYVGTAVGCTVYNVIAKLTGGFEITLEQPGDEASA